MVGVNDDERKTTLEDMGMTCAELLVHCEDGLPIQYEDRHVNPAAAPDYLGVDFALTTPTRYLLEHAPLTEASYSIEASLPSVQEAGPR
jgi:GntR family histidine utilization transcriptional repressor